MAILKIRRKKEFTNITAKYEVYIDEQLVGTLRNGENKEFSTNKGQHTIIIKVKGSRLSSQEISIDTNNTEYLNVSCTKIYVMMSIFRILFVLLAGIIIIFCGVKTICRDNVNSLLFSLFIALISIYFSFCKRILNLEIK